MFLKIKVHSVVENKISYLNFVTDSNKLAHR
uniref:Uncharacterized protein n=1 Tax=Arundo donax TaxID=35708 RepID=A0A0A8YI83_ARUDO